MPAARRGPRGRRPGCRRAHSRRWIPSGCPSTAGEGMVRHRPGQGNRARPLGPNPASGSEQCADRQVAQDDRRRARRRGASTAPRAVRRRCAAGRPSRRRAQRSQMTQAAGPASTVRRLSPGRGEVAVGQRVDRPQRPAPRAELAGEPGTDRSGSGLARSGRRARRDRPRPAPEPPRRAAAAQRGARARCATRCAAVMACRRQLDAGADGRRRRRDVEHRDDDADDGRPDRRTVLALRDASCAPAMSPLAYLPLTWAAKTIERCPAAGSRRSC